MNTVMDVTYCVAMYGKLTFDLMFKVTYVCSGWKKLWIINAEVTSKVIVKEELLTVQLKLAAINVNY